MRIAILGSTESWHVKDLRRAAGGRHEICPVTFRDVAASVLPVGNCVWSLPSGKKTGKRITHTPKPPTPLNSFDLRASPEDGGGRLGDHRVDLTACDAVLVRTMPAGSLEQVVFRMDALARLEASGVPVLNPPKAIETSVDKFLTTARLADSGFCVPRTIVCQTADDAMAAFDELGGDVVVKPIFGGEGRGVTRLDDKALALRALTMLEQLGAVLYVQEFIEHEGYDLRLLVIGNHVLGIRRSSTTDWRTNISRGGHAEPIDVTAELADLAVRAATAVGAPLAGIDLLPARDGRLVALEVNAVPGWKALAGTLRTDVAALVVDLVEGPGVGGRG